MILGTPLSTDATSEYVVPRSIPTILGIGWLPPRDDNLGRSQHAIANSITTPLFADHGVVRNVGAIRDLDREVPLGIKGLANRTHWTDVIPFQQRQQPPLNEEQAVQPGMQRRRSLLGYRRYDRRPEQPGAQRRGQPASSAGHRVGREVDWRVGKQLARRSNAFGERVGNRQQVPNQTEPHPPLQFGDELADFGRFLIALAQVLLPGIG